jgi:hypothetical protein
MTMMMNDLLVEINEEQGANVQGGFSFNLPFFSPNEPLKLANAAKGVNPNDQKSLLAFESLLATEREQAANYSSFSYFTAATSAATGSAGRTGVAFGGNAFGAPPLAGSGANPAALNTNLLQFFWA